MSKASVLIKCTPVCNELVLCSILIQYKCNIKYHFNVVECKVCKIYIEVAIISHTAILIQYYQIIPLLQDKIQSEGVRSRFEPEMEV